MSTSSYDIRKELSALPFWEALADYERGNIQFCAQIRSYERDSLVYARDQEWMAALSGMAASIC